MNRRRFLTFCAASPIVVVAPNASNARGEAMVPFKFCDPPWQFESSKYQVRWYGPEKRWGFYFPYYRGPNVKYPDILFDGFPTKARALEVWGRSLDDVARRYWQLHAYRPQTQKFLDYEAPVVTTCWNWTLFEYKGIGRPNFYYARLDFGGGIFFNAIGESVDEAIKGALVAYRCDPRYPAVVGQRAQWVCGEWNESNTGEMT